MNSILRYILFIELFCFSICSYSQSTDDSDPRPNIILIMADDLGWGDVGFNGSEIIRTPNLDKLASEGIIFDRFYSASPVCSPTRASCLTGRNPYRQGIYTANKGHLKKEEITLAEILREEGYTTGMFGKWHLGTLTTKEKDANRGKPGDNEHYSPPNWHGFDKYFVTESKIPTYDPMFYPKNFDTINGESLRYGWAAVENKEETNNYGTSYWKGNDQKVSVSKLKGENTGLIFDQAIPFMKTAIDQEKAFFTVIWIHTPHLPVVADKENRNKYKRYDHREQLYYGSISAMDEQIGRLQEFLKNEKIKDNTMIWFASDNGPELRTPGSAGKFRGKKRDLYEGGIRVPAFCVWPDKINTDIKTDAVGVTSDYLPTILAMVNMEKDFNHPLDGINLSNIIDRTQKTRMTPLGFQYPNSKSWVTDDYKLIKNDKTTSFELFDINSDPYEQNNLINDFPEIAKKLEKDLDLWIISCKNSDQGMDYSKK